MLVAVLHLELAGSFRSKPTDNRDKFTLPLPEREKLSMGTPWTPISGEIECWEEKKKFKERKKKVTNYEIMAQFQLKIIGISNYQFCFLNLGQTALEISLKAQFKFTYLFKFSCTIATIKSNNIITKIKQK